MRRTGKFLGRGELVQTEGKRNATTEDEVLARVKAAQGGACKHGNITTGTWTDRRTSPPTVTVQVTCDDCKATL